MPNCLETPGHSRFPQFAHVLVQWSLLFVGFVFPFIYGLLPEIMGRLVFDFIGAQAHVVSVLNSLTGLRTKERSFKLAALQLSHLQNRNVLNALYIRNFKFLHLVTLRNSPKSFPSHPHHSV